MAKANKNIAALVNDETNVNKIHLIRGMKVMIDRDLAEMYRVETKVLNQAVRRNNSKFPDDSKFTLNHYGFQAF